MKDSSGKELPNNYPVFGCDKCLTSAGRLGCPDHGYNPSTLPPKDWQPPYCPQHGTGDFVTCDKCLDEMEMEISKINYPKKQLEQKDE